MMAQWVVLRRCTDGTEETFNRWEEILPGGPFTSWGPWEAEDAGGAFRCAVLENKYERLSSSSYRVLRFDGGATFNVGVQVDAAEHAEVGATA